jgi:hypothetical protein
MPNKRNGIPDVVFNIVDTFEQQVEHLAQKLASTEGAIANARERLSGGFQKDQEYRDMRVTLDRLIADKPSIEEKLHATKYTLANSKAFLDALPPDVMLEEVKQGKPNGFDLATVRRRIEDAEDEVKQLRAVRTASADIEMRVREYVAALARPKVSGIGTGQQLRVTWLDDMIAVLALLLPDQMVDALLREVERQANTPMPLPERKKRIAQLTAEIDTLQRQALTLGADAADFPPAIVLGVKVVRREQVRRAV